MIKINKRMCRKFANPDRKLPSGNGIFHAKQIDYIVTTAVKNIAHHRTLILYIYPRKQASEECTPRWVMFHTKDDFLTLSRREDGSTTWRKSPLDCLERNTCDSDIQYAFYSASDESRVQRYFKANTDGFQALSSAQDAILSHRRKQRQIAKEQAIISCMAGISAKAAGDA